MGVMNFAANERPERGCRRETRIACNARSGVIFYRMILTKETGLEKVLMFI